MYATFAFTITMLGVFSIFENIKGKQKLTFFKINILLLLFTITLNCTLEFVEGSGVFYDFVSQLFRLLGSLLTVNLFYLIASKRIPRLVIWIESVLILVYFISEFSFESFWSWLLFFKPPIIHLKKKRIPNNRQKQQNEIFFVWRQFSFAQIWLTIHFDVNRKTTHI
jgi:hypothetical protein